MSSAVLEKIKDYTINSISKLLDLPVKSYASSSGNQERKHFTNFTELLTHLFREGIIVEIGPGIYTPPTISILQNLNGRGDYVALDGAIDRNDCYEKFFQVGGISEYTKEVLERDKQLYSYTHPMVSIAHFLPFRKNSIDAIFYFKSFTKLLDVIIYNREDVNLYIGEWYRNKGIDKLVEKLGEKEKMKLSFLAYSTIVLEEARRVLKRGGKIIVVPEGRILEDDLERELKTYARVTGNDFYVFEVEDPRWVVKDGDRIISVSHWQDRTNPTRKVYVVTKKREKPLNEKGFIELAKVFGINLE